MNLIFMEDKIIKNTELIILQKYISLYDSINK